MLLFYSILFQVLDHTLWVQILLLPRYCRKSQGKLFRKFLDAGIQDVSTSISIEFKIEYLDELIEMSVDDESDKHVEARDRRYSCLKCVISWNWAKCWYWVHHLLYPNFSMVFCFILSNYREIREMKKFRENNQIAK